MKLVAVQWDNGKIFLFRGGQYLRFDVATDAADEGYPKAVEGAWPGVWADGFDAVVMADNGKAFFFKGDEYVRYDLKADRAAEGYPRKLADYWVGVAPLLG